ncbi:replicative DNA helicase [Priestia megaterium]|uniref:replicative DNA helicase n=1 Tax=Priestia megaterium TaxID=1404 RepID=UPI00159BA8D3|nr:DnaB-like helicase C-terminal domain-containing protein [Priestia megaterium]
MPTIRQLQLVNENEQYLIGALLQDGTLVDELLINSEHFFNEHHKNIINEMLCFKSENKQINLLSFAHLSEAKLNKMGGCEYLNNLALSTPSVNNFNFYQQKIIEFNLIKNVRKEISIFLQSTEDEIEIKHLDYLINSLNRLDVPYISETGALQDLLIERMNEHEASNIEGLSGINTGFHHLNTLIDGWQNGDLIILGARPSMGKTAFALNCILESNKNESVQTTLFSIEMAKGQIVDRLIAITGSINLMKLKNPNKHFSDDDWKRYEKATGYLGSLDIDIRPENIVTNIRSIVRKNIKESVSKKHLVVIDFLTLIKHSHGGTANQSKNLEVEQIVIELKRLAVEFNIPIIVLAQLSRQLEQRNDKRPLMSDLRDSGGIEQIADLVIFLYRDDYYNPNTENYGLTEILISKNRNGATGKLFIHFLKETNRFTEVSVN